MNLYVLLAFANILIAGLALASLGFRGAGRAFRFGFAARRDRALGSTAQLMRVAAGSGRRSDPIVTIGRSVHRSGWGVRLFVFVLSGLLLVVAPGLAGGGQLVPGDPGVGYAAILALVAYANAFVWAYRLVIDRNEVGVMGPAFRLRRHPLSALARVDDRGLYTWRMQFSDGRRHIVLKTVVGLPQLRQRLADVLEANARG